jgi:hypothetical protein
MTVVLRKSEEEQPLHVAERMANTMMEMLNEDKTWSIADLRRANFSINDIARYLPEACKIVEQRPRFSQR